MNSVELNDKLVKTYLTLISNLSVEARLDIISQLSLSLKKPVKAKKSIYDLCGSWESDKSAEEINAELRAARTFNRQREEL